MRPTACGDARGARNAGAHAGAPLPGAGTTVAMAMVGAHVGAPLPWWVWWCGQRWRVHCRVSLRCPGACVAVCLWSVEALPGRAGGTPAGKAWRLCFLGSLAAQGSVNPEAFLQRAEIALQRVHHANLRFGTNSNELCKAVAVLSQDTLNPLRIVASEGDAWACCPPFVGNAQASERLLDRSGKFHFESNCWYAAHLPLPDNIQGVVRFAERVLHLGVILLQPTHLCEEFLQAAMQGKRRFRWGWLFVVERHLSSRVARLLDCLLSRILCTILFVRATANEVEGRC